ncbi:hypothetical protein D3C71_1917800 [compost metagenome]
MKRHNRRQVDAPERVVAPDQCRHADDLVDGRSRPDIDDDAKVEMGVVEAKHDLAVASRQHRERADQAIRAR